MLLVDSVGVWSEESASNCDSELHLTSRELSIGERWCEYVPALPGGNVLCFNLDFGCLLLLSATCLFGVEVVCGSVWELRGIIELCVGSLFTD